MSFSEFSCSQIAYMYQDTLHTSRPISHCCGCGVSSNGAYECRDTKFKIQNYWAALYLFTEAYFHLKKHFSSLSLNILYQCARITTQKAHWRQVMRIIAKLPWAAQPELHRTDRHTVKTPLSLLSPFELGVGNKWGWRGEKLQPNAVSFIVLDDDDEPGLDCAQAGCSRILQVMLT